MKNIFDCYKCNATICYKCQFKKRLKLLQFIENIALLLCAGAIVYVVNFIIDYLWGKNGLEL